MSADRAERTRDCGRKDALDFLGRAEKHLEAIELIEHDLPDSAANLAVSTAINASDAVCCARLGKHSRAVDHSAAVRLLGTVSPGGKAMAMDLQRILAKKNDAQYRQTPLSVADAKKVIEWARRLVSNARSAVDHSN